MEDCHGLNVNVPQMCLNPGFLDGGVILGVWNFRGRSPDVESQSLSGWWLKVL